MSHPTPARGTFLAGLVALALGTALNAPAIRRLLPTALNPDAVDLLHGFLLGVALAFLGMALWRTRRGGRSAC